MDANTLFELKAEAFRVMTGHQAPGKDCAPGCSELSFDERMELWNKWTDDNHVIITAFLSAAGRIGLD